MFMLSKICSAIMYQKVYANKKIIPRIMIDMYITSVKRERIQFRRCAKLSISLLHKEPKIIYSGWLTYYINMNNLM